LHSLVIKIRYARKQLLNKFTAVAFLPTFYAREKSRSLHGWSEKNIKKKILNIQEDFEMK